MGDPTSQQKEEAERERVLAIKQGRELSDPAAMRIHLRKLEEALVCK